MDNNKKIIENLVHKLALYIYIKVLKPILRPDAGIVVSVVGILLAFITDESTKNPILILIKNNQLAVVIGCILYAFFTAYYYDTADKLNKRNEKIATLESEIIQLNQKNKEASYFMASNFSQFLDDARQLVFRNKLRDIVESNKIINSAQIYSSTCYSKRNNFENCKENELCLYSGKVCKKFEKKCIYNQTYVFRANFLCAFTGESYEINSVNQIYFNIPENDMLQFNNFFKLLMQRTETNKIEMDSLIKPLKIELCNSIIERLKCITLKENIRDEHRSLLVMYLAIRMLDNDKSLVSIENIKGLKPALFKEIRDGKRMGLLLTHLCRNIVAYSNLKSYLKNNREYMSTQFEYYNKSYIYLAAVKADENTNENIFELILDNVKLLKQSTNLKTFLVRKTIITSDNYKKVVFK